MATNPNALLELAIPQVNEKTFADFEMITYRNGRNHVYGVDENGKKRHISNESILEAYGMGQRSAYVDDVLADGTDNPQRPVLVGYTETKEAAKAVEIAEVVEPTVTEEPEIEEDDLPAAAMAASRGVVATKRRGWFTRLVERYQGLPVGVAKPIGALALVAAGLLGYITDFSPDSSKTLAPVAGKALKNSPDTSLTVSLKDPDNHGTTTTTTPEGATTTTAQANLLNPEARAAEKQAADEAAKKTAEQKSRTEAIDKKLQEIGLQEGQYSEITDENAVFPGPIEAGHFSMNHGPAAWQNRARTIVGSKQMGADLLSGKNGFTASDAEVAQAALRSKGVPQSIIDQLAANNYADLTVKTFLVNSPLYKGMTFNNNGQLAIEALRAGVGTDDVFFIIGFKADTGEFKAVATRGDCGGVGPQPFDTLTVPAPPKPPKKPPTTPPTTPPTIPPTTTTTPPTTTTTTTIPTTTTTTTPPTTTTTTAPKGAVPGCTDNPPFVICPPTTTTTANA